MIVRCLLCLLLPPAALAASLACSVLRPTPTEERALAPLVGSFRRDCAQLRAIAEGLRGGRPVAIRGFLIIDIARAVRAELASVEDWPLLKTATYSQHSLLLYEPEVRSRLPRAGYVVKLFETDALLDWLARLSGVALSHVEEEGRTVLEASVSNYKAGDYSSWHTDDAASQHKVTRRRLAFVLHLTQGWRSGLGGELLWSGPKEESGAGELQVRDALAPAFNVLTLFRVGTRSYHRVNNTALEFPEGYNRLALSGWYHAAAGAAAGEFEAAREHEGFVVVGEGKDEL